MNYEPVDESYPPDKTLEDLIILGDPGKLGTKVWYYRHDPTIWVSYLEASKEQDFDFLAGWLDRNGLLNGL